MGLNWDPPEPSVLGGGIIAADYREEIEMEFGELTRVAVSEVWPHDVDVQRKGLD